jgi:hypothetical protein
MEDNLTFPQAVAQLLLHADGARVIKRPDWDGGYKLHNGRMYSELVGRYQEPDKADPYETIPSTAELRAYAQLTGQDITGACITPEDMNATDWSVVEPMAEAAVQERKDIALTEVAKLEATAEALRKALQERLEERLNAYDEAALAELAIEAEDGLDADA